MALILCVLPACSAHAPEHRQFSADTLVWHLKGPDGFVRGPFGALPACEAVRVRYTYALGVDGDWDQFRCV